MPDQPTILNEATAQKKFSCPTCGGELIQKSRARLIVVGLCMIASVAVAFVIRVFWSPDIILEKVSGSAPAPGAADDAPSSARCALIHTKWFVSRHTVRREGAPNDSRGGCAPHSPNQQARQG